MGKSPCDGGERSRLRMEVAAGPPVECPSVGFVSTYPPTRCGIATFTASLRAAMAPLVSGVVALVDEPPAARGPPEVVATLVACVPASLEMAADVLNTYDVVIVQHEFGIYGGSEGCEVLDLVERLETPMIAVLHTVLRSPSPQRRTIVQQLVTAAERVVVQSATARTRLLETYAVPAGDVRVIPHGATSNLSTRAPAPDRRPVILTWGLLGPSKGIEFVIDALAELRDLDPRPRYVVHGQTHPRVAERQGEAYRESLVAQALALGVDDLVEFEDRYLDTASVLAWIREADVVVLPYRSRDQVVSGVLVEALSSGKPVIATGFPHAVELLSDGSGILVPHEDSSAIAAALRALLTDPVRAARASAAARRQAQPHDWGRVGQTYRELVCSVARRTVEARP